MRYFELKVNKEIKLVVPELTMATDVYNLVNSDRDHLRPFLDFVDRGKDVSSQIDYFKMKMQGSVNETDKLFLIAKQDKIIGCIDLHKMDRSVSKAEIGYWIHSDYTGKNIVTNAVEALCYYAFEVLDLNKLTIFADVNNIASNKVAIKSKFKLVGLKRQDAILYGKYQDMNEYYLLKSDFS